MRGMTWEQYLETPRAQEIWEEAKRRARKTKVSGGWQRYYTQITFMHEVSRAYRRHKELAR